MRNLGPNPRFLPLGGEEEEGEELPDLLLAHLQPLARLQPLVRLQPLALLQPLAHLQALALFQIFGIPISLE